MNLEKSAEEEIADVRMKRPHVVLLGAGASRQAFPQGERNGEHLPVMADFLETASFAEVLTSAGISHAGRNFEELYSQLAVDPAKAAILEALEQAVFQYFSSSPTRCRVRLASSIYGHGSIPSLPQRRALIQTTEGGPE